MVFSLPRKGHSCPETASRERKPVGNKVFRPSGLPLVVEDLLGVRGLCLLRADLRHLLLCEQGTVVPLE